MNKDKARNSSLFLVTILVLFGVFTSGVVSGYFYFRAEQRAINFARDAAISDIQRTLHNLDERTRECLK